MADFSNLLDLAELAQAVGKQSVYVARERCLAVRHRRSRCHACVDVCPAKAIEVSGTNLTFNQGLCEGCMACTTVCPSEALVPLDPPDLALKSDALELMAAAEEKGLPEQTVVIGCARKASKRLVDTAAYVEVPCLCRVHESLILQLVAAGAQHIYLVDAKCRSCKFGSCDMVTQMVLEGVQTLLEAKGASVQIERTSHFPEGMPAYTPQALSASRRAFFTESANQGKNAATTTARFFIRKEAKKDSTMATVLDTFGLTAEDKTKITEPQRMTDLVDALYEVGDPEAEATIDTRFFGTLDLNTDKCSMCGVCAVVCPTKALQRNTAHAGIKSEFLTLWPSDCIQCRLCQEVCFRSCLTVRSDTTLGQIFDFEPQKVGKPSDDQSDGSGKIRMS